MYEVIKDINNTVIAEFPTMTEKIEKSEHLIDTFNEKFPKFERQAKELWKEQKTIGDE